MTDCHDLDRQLAGYLAGRLDDTTATALEVHAGGCERCATLLEERTQLDLRLPREIPPPAGVRERVLRHARFAPVRSSPSRWWIPAAIAASLLIAFTLLRPTPKSAMIPRSADPAAIAAARADGELARLAAARREVEAALRADPGNAELEAALVRLDGQRRQLENIVLEFES